MVKNQKTRYDFKPFRVNLEQDFDDVGHSALDISIDQVQMRVLAIKVQSKNTVLESLL